VIAGATPLVLLWGALPYLPGQIDDPYIVFAYAHRVVEHGEIAWNTGERVEGYSSPLHLLLMVLGCLGGLDLSVFARIVSFASALATLALLLRPRFGPHRHWFALLVAAWQPFQYWSVASLETALATFLAVAGWPLVLAGREDWARGCMILVAYSLTRPEGAAWLAAGLLARLRYPRGWGAPERTVLGGLLLLAAYHVARVVYFGELLPTPWLVKIVAIDTFGGGARELGYEVLSALPLLALALGCRRNIPVWAGIPFVIQAVLLVRAGGDWMGNARFLLPGAIGSVAAGLLNGRPRSAPQWLPVLLVPLAMSAFAWEPAEMQAAGPRWRDPWLLRRPLAAFETPWSVPLLDEVAFLARRIPVGAGAQLTDVGLPGNLEDIRIWDGAGLTDRAVARIIAAPSQEMSETIRARYDDPTAIWCLRYALAADGTDPGDAWLSGLFPEASAAPSEGMVWRCREGGTPSADVVASRWAGLSARFPREDGIRLHYARALIASGRTEEARTVARGATWVGREADGWIAFLAAPGVRYVPRRGWPMYANGVLTSHSFEPQFWANHSIEVDVDDPGDDGARLRLQWNPPCGDVQEVSVHEREAVPLAGCPDNASRSLQVAFLNDLQRPGADRNVYVALRARE
jgi:hypothetical protein